MFGEEYTVSRGNPDIRSMTQALNGYGYALNNPNADPTGLTITQWDKDHLNPNELQRLAELTDQWNKATSDGERNYIHNQAEQLREKYRKPYEVGGPDGNTQIDQGKLNEYIEMRFMRPMLINPKILLSKWKVIRKHRVSLKVPVCNNPKPSIHRAILVCED